MNPPRSSPDAGRRLTWSPSRSARWLIGVVGAWLVLSALAWLALPPLLKWQLETRASALLGREVRVGEVRFAPFTLTLTLEQLSIGPAPGTPASPPLLQVARIVIDADARSLLRLAPVVETLQVEAPRLHLARVAEGHYDVDDLIARLSAPSAEPPGREPARFALFNLRLRDGEVVFDDRPVDRRHVLRALSLDLPFLSNLPDDLEVKVEPHLAFVLNDSAFETRGRSTPFAQGRESEFKLSFAGLDLRPVWAYVPQGLPLQPTGGVLGVDLGLHFEKHDAGAAVVVLKGAVDLRGLELHAADGQAIAGWRALRLRLSDVRPLERRLAFDALQVDGARLHVQRDADGHLNLQRLLEARATTAQDASAVGRAVASSASAASGPSAAAWHVRLDALELNDAEVAVDDASTRPAAQLRLAPVTLRLKDLRWPVEADSAVQLDATLAGTGAAPAELHVEGTATDRQARLAWRVGSLDVALAAPYLNGVLKLQVSGRVDAAGQLQWAAGDAPRLQLSVDELRAENLRLTEPAPARRGAPLPGLQLAGLELSGVEADLLGRRVEVQSLVVHRPTVALVRDASGTLNVERWLGAPDGQAVGAAAAGPSAGGGDWHAELRRFEIDGGRLRLDDAALGAAPIELNALRARVEKLAWPIAPNAAPAVARFGAQLRHASLDTAAPIEWSGSIGLQPLAARGRLRVERLPVHAFEPWFRALLPVVVRRLEAGFVGDVDLRQQGTQWVGTVRGDALLADLSVSTSTAGAGPGGELVGWNALSATRLAVELPPERKPLVAIDELRIVDYRSRVEITEDGRINLQQVAQPPAAAASSGVASSPTAAASASASAQPSSPASGGAAAPAAAIAAPSAMLSELPVDLVVGSTVFSNARVDFADRFIRPNYSAELSELNGRLGRIDSRSREPATLQAQGRVAGTGRLEIDGTLNPTVRPPVLDLKAKASDIELPGLTPYAAKYAGYPIERGKLSVDVAYRIDADGKLDASNRIVVNQLTFGPKTDSPDATKLPVLLAVALLQDRYGVIDIDLPVSGSLNDPQFSIGGLIWKVIVNLLTKALTAPFSLLAGGGGPDLSTVEFQPGTARIADSGQQVVDKVAKSLADRPALKLTITGEADASQERSAMQHAALEARLQAEQRRERGRAALGAGAAAADEAPAPMTEAERERLLKRIYADTPLPDKPRNLIGLTQDLPAADMEARLVAAEPVDAAAERRLAVQRGRAVREALLARGLSGDRVFLAEAKTAAPDRAASAAIAGASADAKPDTADAKDVRWGPQARLVLAID